jgi:hypothetical protein
VADHATDKQGELEQIRISHIPRLEGADWRWLPNIEVQCSIVQNVTAVSPARTWMAPSMTPSTFPQYQGKKERYRRLVYRFAENVNGKKHANKGVCPCQETGAKCDFGGSVCP